MQNVRTAFLTFLVIGGLAESAKKISAVTAVKSQTLRGKFNNQTSTTRNPKIMFGFPTRDGEFGWQASLELLHPSLGFIGHWCGCVLIHRYWVISSAHCIHNDLFNLPLPALWTVVLGENNRKIESGYEQRIPVDKIIIHEKYRHFKNDLVLLKLGRAANLSQKSRVKNIFLPSSSHIKINPNDDTSSKLPSLELDEDLFERNENYLRKLKSSSDRTMDNVNKLPALIAQANQHEITKRQSNNKTQQIKSHSSSNSKIEGKGIKVKNNRRRNDKFLHRRTTSEHDEYLINLNQYQTPSSSSVDYFDCVAVGWGKYMNSGDLSDVLLKIEVPIQNIKRCEDAYSGYVSLHHSQHLCAGNLNGSGGACVGDSGSGLQCKLNRDGPWILVGITSFGSGCAKEGYADVFTNVAYYRTWIDNVMRNN